MYNKNNRLVLLGSMFLIAISSMVNFSHVYAVSLGSMDTFVQKTLSNVGLGDTASDLTNPMKVGNIYSTAYSYAQEQTTVTTVQSILTVQQELNTKYSCNLDLKDMEVFLNSVGYVVNSIEYAQPGYLEKINNNALKKPEELKTYVAVCRKLISCKNGVVAKLEQSSTTCFDANGNPSTKCSKSDARQTSLLNSLQKEQYQQQLNTIASAQLTSDEFILCNTEINNLYATAKNASTSIGNLATATMGNDIYYNGTIKDSPFDILYDIQKIGDVLFSNNQATESFIQYTFPNKSIAGLQTIPFGSTPSNFIPQNNNDSLPSYAYLQNTSQFPNTNSGGSGGGIIDNTITGSQVYTATNRMYTNSTPIAPAGNDIINNYSCIPTSANTTDFINSGISTTASPDTGALFPGSIPSPNMMTDITTSNGTVNPDAIPGPGYNTDVVDDITEMDRESPDSYQQAESKILACMKTCDGLKATDKAMCAARCMCGGVESKGGMFNLRICTVPSTYTSVVSKKPVQSIQEIIAEINNVLTALRNSGQLIKHTKTTEFLDTSLSKIKLNQIFAFDVNIAWKPVLNEKSRIAQEAANDDRTDKTINGSYDSIDIGPEKNKYIQYRNADLTEAQSRGGKTIDERLQNISDAGQLRSLKTLNSDIATQTAKSINPEVASIVQKFLEQNIQYWASVTDIMRSIQLTADEFKQKILQAK